MKQDREAEPRFGPPGGGIPRGGGPGHFGGHGGPPPFAGGYGGPQGFNAGGMVGGGGGGRQIYISNVCHHLSNIFLVLQGPAYTDDGSSFRTLSAGRI